LSAFATVLFSILIGQVFYLRKKVQEVTRRPNICLLEIEKVLSATACGQMLYGPSEVPISFATACLKESLHAPHQGEDALSEAQEMAIATPLEVGRKNSIPINPQVGICSSSIASLCSSCASTSSMLLRHRRHTYWASRSVVVSSPGRSHLP
jgi:hypothetical protein